VDGYLEIEDISKQRSVDEELEEAKGDVQITNKTDIEEICAPTERLVVS
jgi:hypothetical protein